MSEKKGTQASFTRSFPWPKGIVWLGPQGFVKMTDGRVAVIELTEHGVCDTWSGFLVRVLHTRSGEIDRKLFLWSDHLEIKNEGDAQAMARQLAVHGHCGWEWHILKPKDTVPIVRAIFRYLTLFDDTFEILGKEG